MIRFPLCLALAAACLAACLVLSPRPALAASAASRGIAQDIADLDQLLSRAEPGQDSIFVDDMGFKVGALQNYRQRLAERQAGGRQAHSSFLPSVSKWPGGVVPYAFDANVSAANRTAFVAACHDWEQVAAIHFHPRAGENDYVLVHFQQYNNSYVGRIGGPQDLNLYNFNYEFIICHELGHALGLIHEHERSDRDTYITIHMANVTSGMEPNFDIVPGSLNQGAYDFDSVMHYGPTAFSSNGQPTMTVNAPYAAQYGNAIGQFSHLSVSDKAGMAAIYGAPTPPAPVSAPLAARVLWTNTNGMASLWSVDTAGGVTHGEVGPYSGWTARSVVSGPDGKARLLWTAADGTASFWTVAATGVVSHTEYGPYSNWAASALSVGPDSLPRVLWTRTDGMMSLWTMTAAGDFTHIEYGPYAGWAARALSALPDGKSQILWNGADGAASLWTVSGSSAAHVEYGPFAGWGAKSLAVGPDGVSHLLWTRSEGAVSLWTGTPGGGFMHQEAGPFAGWTAAAVSVGSDNGLHLLWNGAGGAASLWSRGNGESSFTHAEYGPFGGWQAVGLAGK